MFKKMGGGRNNFMNRKMKVLAFGSLIITLLSCIMVFSVATTNCAAKQIRVACVGDSITEGSGYPNKLNLLLGSNYLVGNFGVSGSTVSLDSKKPYLNEHKFQEAMNFHPDIVVMMLGTNDANPEISPNEDSFETDYSQLITDFEHLDGRQLIWIVKSPPIFANNSSYNNTYLESTVLLEIDELAEQMSLPTVDVYSALGNHSDCFMDGVHPNSDGAALIASDIYDAITLPDGSLDTSYFSNGYIG
jgi:acyl-CoA thioesterase I